MCQKKMIIFGCSPFSRVLRYDMEAEAGLSVTAYSMTEDYMKETTFDGLPVYSLETLDETFGKDNFEVLNTVGYRGMNVGREKIFRLCEKLGYGIASFIHPDTRMAAESIGRGNIIVGRSWIQPFCQIGDGNILSNASLGHESRIGNFNYFSGGTTGGLVTIGDNCFLGMRSCVCDGISVGSYSLIGAGAVLSKSVGDNTLVAPPAARVTRGRPEDLGRLFHLGNR